MTPEQLVDEQQAVLCREYGELGSAAIPIRTMADGNYRIIGPELEPQRIADMLRSAATVYLEQAAKQQTIN
jgi:hypothetical protein